jgi:hypothetical protein
MASACVIRPHRDTGFAPGVPMRPSRFLRGALLGCVGIASAAVCQCVFAHTGHAGDAAVAGVVTVAALGVASYRWMRAQPAAVRVLSDGLTLWNRSGDLRAMRIEGCAQWSDRLLALTLATPRGRREALLVAADSIDAETFRQLAVQARRAAASHL